MFANETAQPKTEVRRLLNDYVSAMVTTRLECCVWVFFTVVENHDFCVLFLKPDQIGLILNFGCMHERTVSLATQLITVDLVLVADQPND